MINVRTSVQTVMIGTSVEFECQALGEPEPTVQWSKVGGSLPAHVMVKGGMLRIEQVTEADAGQYRCTATNDVGSVQSQVVLNVQCECPSRSPSASWSPAARFDSPILLLLAALPQISALPEKKEVTVGSDAVLPCVASGYPAPEIRWSKVTIGTLSLFGKPPPKTQTPTWFHPAGRRPSPQVFPGRQRPDGASGRPRGLRDLRLHRLQQTGQSGSLHSASGPR